MVAQSHDNEFCPSCGEFVPQINSITGWCENCSGSIEEISHSQFEAFLKRNADHIEHYIAQGLSFKQTLHRVRDELRPTCIVCGNEIKRAKLGAVFCLRYQNCRRWQRRYKYLYQEKSLSKAGALAQVFHELQGE